MTQREIGVSGLLEAMIAAILDNASIAVIDGAYFAELRECVAASGYDAPSPLDLARQHIATGPRLLDFGCGLGAYRGALQAMGYVWTGLNYKAGMASGAAAQAVQDGGILFYDGVNLPFEDGAFDVVFSFQTFEHIQHPDATFSEISRVLRPGGKLIGSVSYLEQIHDYSTFNFTPYGFKMVVERCGFTLRDVYPQNDVFSFLMRRLLVVTTASDDTSLNASLGPNGPVHRAIIQMGERLGLPPERINLLRLMFCANFAFLVENTKSAGQAHRAG